MLSLQLSFFWTTTTLPTLAIASFKGHHCTTAEKTPKHNYVYNPNCKGADSSPTSQPVSSARFAEPGTVEGQQRSQSFLHSQCSACPSSSSRAQLCSSHCPAGQLPAPFYEQAPLQLSSSFILVFPSEEKVKNF